MKGRNWRTTIAGLGLIIGSIGALATGLSTGSSELDYGLLVTNIVTGIGFILSGDAKNSS